MIHKLKSLGTGMRSTFLRLGDQKLEGYDNIPKDIPDSDAKKGRAALSRGADHGLLPHSDASRPVVPKGSDENMHLMSRGNEHAMMHSYEESQPMMSWGSEGSIFVASDDHGLTRQILKLHFPDARNVDVRPLLQLVEEIIERATHTIDGPPAQDVVSEREAMELKRSVHGLEEVLELPLSVARISSEISCKILSGSNSHETTLSVLKILGTFSWEAKVVLTLAAFSMTYGDFWLLVPIYSTNSQAKSMALIKRLPIIVEHVGSFKHQFETTNNLIKAMLETSRCIVEFGELPATHITAEDPQVKATISHFPVAVYWVIRSCVAAATQITTLSSRGLDQKGTKSGASMKCGGCEGAGVKVSFIRMGPMAQQVQKPCDECRGIGEKINDKDRCPQCKGKKVVLEKKVLEVVVEKGMQHGQKITFSGAADEAPDTVTGDVVIVIQQKEHPKLKRKDADLFFEHNLSFTEALCGFTFVLTHLDGRQLLVKSNPGEVIKPDSFKAVENEGMPIYQRPFMKGKLYIHFTVEFPESLSLDQIKALEGILPPKPSMQLTDMELDECEETTLHNVNIEEEMKRKQAQSQQEAYDEDDEPQGAQRVQCAQQ